MKWLNGYRMRLVVVGIVGVLVLGGGRAKADSIFGQRVNLGPVVNSPYGEGDPFIAPDGLSLYFGSTRPGGLGGDDIWMTTKQTSERKPEGYWGPPVNLGAPVNSQYREGGPSITADGLTLAFNANRPGGLGRADIWLTTRPTTESPWGPPMNIGSPINSAGDDFCGCISADGCSLYFSNALSFTDNDIYYGGDTYVTTRPTTDSPWGPPVNLGLMPSRGGSANWDPSISSDGLALFFDSDYVNVSLLPDIWLATRTSNDGSWDTPILLGPEINTSDGEQRPSISADGSTLYWGSGRAGINTWDLWQSTISPIVDFNGDGIVDSADMCIMVDHWGEDYPLCDIGPMPWGDGIVDVEDLKVLTEHLFEEVDDPTLIAHWPLDEVQGVTAYNNTADCDGTLIDGPVWQPDGGMVGGTLQFDGIDDYVGTQTVLNPADPEMSSGFSVVTWIRGGAPGQVALSQADGSNWLCLDSIEGCLMTELKASGRGAAGPLLSQTVVTDGEWHRIGVVWDGSYRHLYIDGAEVAGDAAPLSALEGSYGGLYFGVGSTVAPGTYFSGLIDDIRIYSRAVSP